MNGLALLGSALINVAGLVVGLSPGHWPGDRAAYRDIICFPGDILDMPALYLASTGVRRDDWPDPKWSGLYDDSGCPRSARVDAQAEPDFPLVGPGRPFRRAAPAARNPAFCVQIGADGRIRRIRLLDGAPDAALLAELRRLRFTPARRDGAPAAAWHWLIVNLPYAPPGEERPAG